MISFLLNDKPVNITEVDPNTTLQSFVRNNLNLTGSKEGCASGDCGACTLVIAELNQQQSGLIYKSINSCITLLSAVHGKQLLTVEHLANNNIPHPVQQAMIDKHGSQCGYCTPGFVMSMFALFKQQGTVDKHAVDNALSGNLCRCTGYRPIIDATLDVCNHTDKTDKFSHAQADTVKKLKALPSAQGIKGLHQPTTREQLRQLLADHANARLVSGGTDLVLEITQNQRRFEQLISLNDVEELGQINILEDGVQIGAAVPLNQLHGVLLKYFPELDELLIRFASTPIRNQATLGGNLANASPIGDFPPVLLALNATIQLDDGLTKRNIKAAQFFTGYRQTLLTSCEWISSVFIPFKQADSLLAAYKVSKRIEDDISAVCGVFYIQQNKGVITRVNTGFGGVAATPVRAEEFEQKLVGQRLSDPNTRDLGVNLLASAFTPLTDVRASAEYRSTIVGNLWRRLWYQGTQPQIQTRINHHA